MPAAVEVRRSHDGTPEFQISGRMLNTMYTNTVMPSTTSSARSSSQDMKVSYQFHAQRASGKQPPVQHVTKSQ